MFVIVRHGNTFAAGEPARRIGSRTDLPLTAEGVAQADALGAYFADSGVHFARVLVAPLRRTRETAERILDRQPCAITPEVSDWLREIDHGPDEDQPDDAVIARIGNDALAAWDRHAKAPPGWVVDAGEREQAWRDLFAADAAPGPTLIVTSNGAARFALLSDAALTANISSLPSLKLPTGGYGIIRRNHEGGLEVPVWGKRP